VLRSCARRRAPPRLPRWPHSPCKRPQSQVTVHRPHVTSQKSQVMPHTARGTSVFTYPQPRVHTLTPSPSAQGHTLTPSPSAQGHTLTPSPSAQGHTLTPSPSGPGPTLTHPEPVVESLVLLRVSTMRESCFLHHLGTTPGGWRGRHRISHAVPVKLPDAKVTELGAGRRSMKVEERPCPGACLTLPWLATHAAEGGQGAGIESREEGRLDSTVTFHPRTVTSLTRFICCH